MSLDLGAATTTFPAAPPHAKVMVVNDTTKDPRFKTSQFVPWPPLTRFYAAAPLVSPWPGLAGPPARPQLGRGCRSKHALAVSGLFRHSVHGVASHLL